ncbi:MAG: acyl-CoA thioesterase [Alphaproteobacteria bacterium]|nr:MAG: acyl-CoA thioesterase [Alphaproteobacteria bacterium]
MPYDDARRGEKPLNEQAKPAGHVPALEQFPGRTHDIIRFGDLDPQGHVNNTVFATFFETGRVAFLREPGNALSPPGTTSVLARLDINFLKELHWPGAVEIGTGVAEIGRSSFTFLQAIFHAGACAATGRATMVMIDAATRRSRPLPAEAVARLEKLRIASGE